MIDKIVGTLVDASRRLGWSPSADAVEVGPYSIVAELAGHLVARAEANSRAGFSDVFGAVEDGLRDATSDTRDLLIVGFLEDLQNISLNRGVPLESWLQWLGPETRSSWTVVERFWAGELSADQFNAFIAGKRPRSD